MVYINKWHTFAAASLLQLVGGICYTFSLYSPELKRQLNYDQRQLQAVGAAILAGGYTSWIPGLLYDGLVQRHHKTAPRLMACLGIIFHISGWGGLWLAATHRLDLGFPAVVGCALLSSIAIVWLDTADIVTCMLNFPAHGGDVAGILKAFLGLSASIGTAIYTGYFAPQALDFLAFLALGPAALAACTIPFLNHVPHTQRSEAAPDAFGFTSSGRFGVICVAVGAIIAYQAASAATGALLPAARSPSVQFWLMCGVLAMLACTILSIPVGSGGLQSKPAGPADSAPPSQEALLAQEASQPDPEALKADVRDPDMRTQPGTSPAVLAAEAAEASAGAVKGLGQNPTLPQCLGALDFWLLFSSLFIGTGAGFMLLNNLGQMVESLGGPPGGQDILVLLFTTANCLGRLACGWASEVLLHGYGTPRTLFPILGAAGWTIVLGFTAYAPYKLLGLTAGFGGFVFGCHWPLMPALTAELFGLRHFAANQTPISLATALGSFVLSQQLAGRLYQSHVPPGEANCYGKYCFRDTMLVLATLAALQTGAASVLYARTKPFYRRKFLSIQRSRHISDD